MTIYRLDEFRISAGAMWLSNFTPPSTTFTGDEDPEVPHEGSIVLTLYVRTNVEPEVISPHDGEISFELNLGLENERRPIVRNLVSSELVFNFLNALNSVDELLFNFRHSLTENGELIFNFRNNVLWQNEGEKTFSFRNSLLSETIVVEEYDGFYFDKRLLDLGY
jgi:hypothetical protein